MNDFGFIRVAAAVPKVKVANPRENVAEICSLASEAFDNGTSLVVFRNCQSPDIPAETFSARKLS